MHTYLFECLESFATLLVIICYSMFSYFLVVIYVATGNDLFLEYKHL